MNSLPSRESDRRALRVCFFGYHEQEGARYWVIREGLRTSGVEVIAVHTQVRGFFHKCIDLWRQWRKVRCDVLCVTFPGQYLVPLAWLLARLRGVPLVFDAFISLYDTKVCDRALVHPQSFTARFLWWMDYLSCHLADRILLDTDEHASYFAKTFSLPLSRFIIHPIGCRMDTFFPVTSPSPPRPLFTVEFHGTFIPLQGIETILRAQKLLEERHLPIRLILIGAGQTKGQMQVLSKDLGLQSVTFLGMQSPGEIRAALGACDCALGIFGTTEKAQRVLPHKAYEILATARPLITARTPTTERMLHDGVDALLVSPGNPEELAATIERLFHDPVLRERIALTGRALFIERYQPLGCGRMLLHWIREHSSHGT